MLRRSAPYVALFLGLVLGAALSYTSPANASRNSSGTYSLPAGNPVISGTTIASGWANSTMPDVATELTSSLDRNGRGAMLAPLQLTNGTNAAPSLTFATDPDTGFYRVGANNPAIAAGGNKILECSSTQALIVDGSVSVPGLAFSSDVDTGLYRIGANNAALGANGVKAIEWNGTGVALPLGALVTQSGTNQTAITSTGNGTGTGVAGSGGVTGAGVSGTGGATSGVGGAFLGGGTSSTAVTGTGGAPNGTGMAGTGDGTGWGTYGQGGDSSGVGARGIGGAPNGAGVQATGAGSGGGVVADSTSGYACFLTGNATKAPLHFVPQSDPSSISDGDVWMTGSSLKFKAGGITYTVDASP